MATLARVSPGPANGRTVTGLSGFNQQPRPPDTCRSLGEVREDRNSFDRVNVRYIAFADDERSYAYTFDKVLVVWPVSQELNNHP